MANSNQPLESIELRSCASFTALRMAVMMSGKTNDQIAKEMDWSPSVSARFFQSGDYHPPLDQLPRFCRVVGNTLIVDWITAQSQSPKSSGSLMRPESLLRDMGGMLGDVSAFIKAGHESVEDGILVEQEVKRIIKAVRKILKRDLKVLSEAESLLSDIRSHKASS